MLENSSKWISVPEAIVVVAGGPEGLFLHMGLDGLFSLHYHDTYTQRETSLPRR